MATIHDILDQFRNAAVSEREKGTYFEELIVCYLKNEATYRDLYQNVWTYSEWADRQGLDRRDTGIDLVAETQGTGEFHAIQCKNYAPDYRIQKKDIDSFFTASGKKPFAHRIIVATANNWSEHAEDALQGHPLPKAQNYLGEQELAITSFPCRPPRKIRSGVRKTKHSQPVTRIRKASPRALNSIVNDAPTACLSL